jgi:hypothetical protein
MNLFLKDICLFFLVAGLPEVSLGHLKNSIISFTAYTSGRFMYIILKMPVGRFPRQSHNVPRLFSGERPRLPDCFHWISRQHSPVKKEIHLFSGRISP